MNHNAIYGSLTHSILLWWAIEYFFEIKFVQEIAMYICGSFTRKCGDSKTNSLYCVFTTLLMKSFHDEATSCWGHSLLKPIFIEAISWQSDFLLNTYLDETISWVNHFFCRFFILVPFVDSKVNGASAKIDFY